MELNQLLHSPRTAGQTHEADSVLEMNPLPGILFPENDLAKPLLWHGLPFVVARSSDRATRAVLTGFYRLGHLCLNPPMCSSSPACPVTKRVNRAIPPRLRDCLRHGFPTSWT